MDTFRNALRVSTEWNAAIYNEKETQHFFETVVELTTSLTDTREIPGGY